MHSYDFVGAGSSCRRHRRPIPRTSSSAGSRRRAKPADDRDEFDAAEGQPVDEIEPTRSIAERRQAVHDKAKEALGEMKSPSDE